MPKNVNPRQKKLDAICTKLATFIVSETFTDEPEVQQKLSQAIALIDQAAALCVANDNAQVAKENAAQL